MPRFGICSPCMRPPDAARPVLMTIFSTTVRIRGPLDKVMDFSEFIIYILPMAKSGKDEFDHALDAWLSKHDIVNKDDFLEVEERRLRETEERRQALKSMKYQAVLDLHGKTKGEAEAECNAFLRECSAKGLLKVLIVHGKGHHSGGQPVLKKTVYDILASCAFTGVIGIPGRAEGGKGAVWVTLRQRSR